MSAHFLRKSAEKQGGADGSSKEELEVSFTPASSPALSASGRRRARHAARTSLAHSTPRMLCVSTHYPSDPNRAKRPPRLASPTDFGGSVRRPLEVAPSTSFSGQQTLQHEFSTHFKALSSATIGSLRCSFHRSNRVLFLSTMLSLRSGS